MGLIMLDYVEGGGDREIKGLKGVQRVSRGFKGGSRWRGLEGPPESSGRWVAMVGAGAGRKGRLAPIRGQRGALPGSG